MISIIGAGPSGNHIAYLLAKKGNEVNVYEEHLKIGSPVQCTGIVTSEIEKIISIKKEFLVNKINQAIIYSPDGNSIQFKFNKPDLIISREKFDQYLADRAMKAGAKYHLGSRYLGNDGKKLKINDKIVATDYLIGADGPFSRVARSNGMYEGRKFVYGDQFTVKTKCEKSLVEFWLGYGMFSWLVPEDEYTARVGVVAYQHPDKHLKKLMDKRCPKTKILSREPGAIPLYNPKQVIQKNNVYLVGDAATQVKATSFGGLVHGLEAAEILAKDMKNYQKNCRKKVGRELYLSLLIRRALDNFKEEDYNQLVRMFNKNKLKKVLETKSRDYPTRFIVDLLVAEPRLLKFVTKLI